MWTIRGVGALALLSHVLRFTRLRMKAVSFLLLAVVPRLATPGTPDPRCFNDEPRKGTTPSTARHTVTHPRKFRIRRNLVVNPNLDDLSLYVHMSHVHCHLLVVLLHQFTERYIAVHRCPAQKQLLI